MPFKSLPSLLLLFALGVPAAAQEPTTTEPAELEVLASWVGTWDASFEVWAAGRDQAPMTFTGVETNRAFGRHWIASDLDSEIMGQTLRVHSIVGYDLDRGMLVGTIVDHGPYAATMTGEYDAQSKTVSWTTHAKDPSGNPMRQHTEITQVSPDERVLVLSVPKDADGEHEKFMRIKFVRRP